MISVRIYNNGSYVVNNVRPEHIAEHIEYNKTFRFGCALVIDGDVKNIGYLDESKINDIVSKIDTSRYKTFSELPYR